jgi:hypothetical protein
MGLFLSVALLVATMFVLGDEKGKAQSSGAGYPKIAELLSGDKTVRFQAFLQYESTQDKLSQQLAQVVHPDTGKNLDKELRGNACFLLAQIRTKDSDRRAIEVLIAAIDENFLPPFGSEIPDGILEPPDALIAIGKPAVKPVLDELANTDAEGARLVSLRKVLCIIEGDGIEGADCALIRTQAHIDKEADPKKKARLKATLEWLEGLKARRQKK